MGFGIWIGRPARCDHWLYAYSPYHHVEDGRKYPAVLFITGDGDTRVAPLHARKMAARLQAATISGLPMLLMYDTQAGHSDEGSVEKQIVEYTNFLRFSIGSWELSATKENNMGLMKRLKLG